MYDPRIDAIIAIERMRMQAIEENRILHRDSASRCDRYRSKSTHSSKVIESLFIRVCQ